MTPDRGSARKCYDQLVMSVGGRRLGNEGLCAMYFLFLYENESKAAQRSKLCMESNWGGTDV